MLVILENDDVREAQNLAAVTRELLAGKIESAIFDPLNGFPEVLPEATRGLIVGGGLPSVNDSRAWIAAEVELVRRSAAVGIPVLGICFGHQLIAKAYGAEVVRRQYKAGFAAIEKLVDDPLLAGTPMRWQSPVYHHDRVEELPAGFELIATSEYCAVQAMRHRELPIWSVQFHPEIRFGINKRFMLPVEEWDDETGFEPTPNQRLLENFIDICLGLSGG